MRFDIITIFPEIINAYAGESILKRAQEKKLIKITAFNLRDFAKDKHKKVDDKPFGGGPGMVFKAEPLIRAIEKAGKSSKIENKKKKVIFFEPAGKILDDNLCQKLAKDFKNLILVCGHYEGFDERIKKMVKDQGYKIEEISIGNYVLTGGELPALVLVDSISRKIKGVLGKTESLEEFRHGIGVPAYTRPAEIIYKNKKYKAPKIIISGNHKKIDEWRAKNKK